MDMDIFTRSLRNFHTKNLASYPIKNILNRVGVKFATYFQKKFFGWIFPAKIVQP